MLRINLLPPYIYEGAKRRNVMILWFVVLAAVIGGFLFWKITIDKETQRIKDMEAAEKPNADKATANASQASSINSQSAIIRGKADFVTNAIKYDQKTYQELLTNIAVYTWPKVLYDNVSPAGSTVSMGAYAPSLADVGHYMMYMERNPAISRVDIAMNSIPGFPNDGTSAGGQGSGGVRPLKGGGHDFQVSLTLVKPVDGAPSYPAAGGTGTAGADTGGGPGGPGGPGGSGGMAGFGGSGGGPPGGGMGASGNAAGAGAKN